MPSIIIDGTAVAKNIKEELKEYISKKEAKPGLAVILVGNRPDSETYVKMKGRAAEEIGIKFQLEKFPDSVKQNNLIAKIRELNMNKVIHGIIVQLPLPGHIDEQIVLSEISYEKDVDGLDVRNIGWLAQRLRTPLFEPCTAAGCIELLDREGIEIKGKHAVVVGASNIVGRPVSLLLLKRDATVTICHIETKNLRSHLIMADILIVAIGDPLFIKGEWIKPGAVVLDVGINKIKDDTKKSGFRLVGDVDFDSAKNVAGYITPVPGGIGPMTVVKLMENVYKSFARQ